MLIKEVRVGSLLFDCLLSVRLVNFNMYHKVFSQKIYHYTFDFRFRYVSRDAILISKNIVKRHRDSTEANRFYVKMELTYTLYEHQIIAD